MKGLLVKELYMAKKFYVWILPILAVFLAISVAEEENWVFLIASMTVSSIIPVILIGYDERDKWEAYSGTLPYTRAQLVSAKYLVGVCLGAAAFFMSATAILVRMQVLNEFSLEKLAWVGAALLAMGCVFSAVALPFVFKYGVEKGLVAYMIVVSLASVSGGVLAGIGFEVQVPPGNLLLLAAVAVGSVVLYVLSWRLSIFFYQKREL